MILNDNLTVNNKVIQNRVVFQPMEAVTEHLTETSAN